MPKKIHPPNIRHFENSTDGKMFQVVVLFTYK